MAWKIVYLVTFATIVGTGMRFLASGTPQLVDQSRSYVSTKRTVNVRLMPSRKESDGIIAAPSVMGFSLAHGEVQTVTYRVLNSSEATFRGRFSLSLAGSIADGALHSKPSQVTTTIAAGGGSELSFAVSVDDEQIRGVETVKVVLFIERLQEPEITGA